MFAGDWKDKMTHFVEKDVLYYLRYICYVHAIWFDRLTSRWGEMRLTVGIWLTMDVLCVEWLQHVQVFVMSRLINKIMEKNVYLFYMYHNMSNRYPLPQIGKKCLVCSLFLVFLCFFAWFPGYCRSYYTIISGKFDINAIK